MTRRMKQHRKFNTGKICVLVIVAVLAIFVFCKALSIKERTGTYEAQIAELEEAIEEENLRAEELEDYEQYVKTDEYAEKIARSRLGLIYDGEIIFREE